MQPCRIILANGSRFLQEMLKRVIEKTPDLQVVGEIAGLAQLSSTIAKTEAEWVIVSLLPDGKIPEMVESSLIAHPSVRVLALAADGSQVKMKWIEPREKILDDLSMDELIAILRKHHR
jgi:DNA-binding NarL/FixJ family response regulator